MRHSTSKLLTIAILSAIASFSLVYSNCISPVVAHDGDAILDATSPIRLLGIGEIRGDSRDLSGLNKALIPVEGTTSDEIPEGRKFSNDLFGGISAICWSGTDDIYWMLPDRGPLDGAVDWTCRLQKVRLIVDASGSKPIKTELLDTVLLRDERGIPFTGLASAYQRTESRTRRFDPEGVRVTNSGNLIISDEYGPRVIEFTPNGQFVQELLVPKRYLISNPDVSKSTENPKNHSGRATNRGMEGLAISEDGRHLFGLMQSPLLQDSFRASPDEKPSGLNCRLPCFDVESRFGREYVYQLESESNKLNEILYCGPKTFVAIERDGEAGSAARFKQLMLISTSTASDIASIEKLPPKGLPRDVEPVAKKVLINLLDETWQLSGDQMPEKIEGLAFGPNIGPNQRLLLVASDNDFVPEQSTMIYAFSVPQSALGSSAFAQQ